MQIDGEPKASIDWLAYMLLSGKSNRHSTLRSVPHIKGFGSTLWLKVDNEHDSNQKDCVDLSALLQQEGSLRDSLDTPLDQDGYIFKAFCKRMELAKPYIDDSYGTVAEESQIAGISYTKSQQQFGQANAQKGTDILNDLEKKTYREYIYLEHDILRAEYEERSKNYKNECGYLQLNMKLAALGYGLVGGLTGAICAKLFGRPYVTTVAAGAVLGSLIGAGKEYNTGYKQVQKSKQEVEVIEPVYNNWKLFKEEIAYRAPSIRDETINWGKKVLPFDENVITE